jgi:hypothetical protein
VQPPAKKQAKEKRVVSSTRGRKRKFSSIQDNPSSAGPSKLSKIPRRRIFISTQLITKDYSRITRSYTARQKNENVNTKPQKKQCFQERENYQSLLVLKTQVKSNVSRLSKTNRLVKINAKMKKLSKRKLKYKKSLS